MRDSRSFIRQMVLSADDLSPAHRANLIMCLETERLPTFQISGPLYVNASTAAEIMGIGRTKFPEVVAYRGIPQHELTPGWINYFTPDLIVHQPKDVQTSPHGLTVFPPQIMPASLSSSESATRVA